MAKNFNKSEYAINKYSSAIVYLGSKGPYELTEAEFLRQNPGMTKEDFAFWKAWSDEDYKEELRAETEDKRHTVSIHELEETKAVCIPSAEDIYVEITSKTEIRTYSKKDVKRFLSTLTKTQRKRFWMREGNGLTFRRIAEIEGVDVYAIEDTFQCIEKKIKKFKKLF